MRVDFSPRRGSALPALRNTRSAHGDGRHGPVHRERYPARRTCRSHRALRGAPIHAGQGNSWQGRLDKALLALAWLRARQLPPVAARSTDTLKARRPRAVSAIRERGFGRATGRVEALWPQAIARSDIEALAGSRRCGLWGGAAARAPSARAGAAERQSGRDISAVVGLATDREQQAAIEEIKNIARSTPRGWRHRRPAEASSGARGAQARRRSSCGRTPSPSRARRWRTTSATS